MRTQKTYSFLTMDMFIMKDEMLDEAFDSHRDIICHSIIKRVLSI